MAYLEDLKDVKLIQERAYGLFVDSCVNLYYPQRAGDEFLTDNQACIDVAFVMGSALFIQLSKTVSGEWQVVTNHLLLTTNPT